MMGKKKEEIEVPDAVMATEASASSIAAEYDARILKLTEKITELDLKLTALKGGFIQLGRRLQRIVMDFTAVKSASVSLNYALNNCESNLVTFAQALNALNIEDEKSA